MDPERRNFLATAGAAGALSLVGAGPGAPKRAYATAMHAGGSAASGTTARGLILACLRKGDALGLGIKTDRGILDVARAAEVLGILVPMTMDEVIHGRGDGVALAGLVAKAKELADGTLFHDEGAAELGPAVPDPGKIVCIGLNYRKHAMEIGQPIPTVPILFNKFNNSINRHGGEIAVSAEAALQFDYEAELVVVMGRKARNVGEAEALDYVFGYCTGNDFTARDLQMRTSQWLLGKSCDGFAPIGPYLVTADLVPDPNALGIECRVNGELRQSSNTADMVFNCRQLISYISQHITLEPGDIIFTGTPEGVIIGYPPQKRVWLKKGDRIATAIEGLGELHFTLT